MRLHIAGLIFISKVLFPPNVIGSVAGQRGTRAYPPFSLTRHFCFCGCLRWDGVLLPSSPLPILRPLHPHPHGMSSSSVSWPRS